MMNCPQCCEEITKLARRCSRCGTDFGSELHDKLTFYFGMQDELQKLTNLQNLLIAGIANVTARIERYEEVLRGDLAGLSAATPASSKPVQRKKKKR